MAFGSSVSEKPLQSALNTVRRLIPASTDKDGRLVAWSCCHVDCMVLVTIRLHAGYHRMRAMRAKSAGPGMCQWRRGETWLSKSSSKTEEEK